MVNSCNGSLNSHHNYSGCNYSGCNYSSSWMNHHHLIARSLFVISITKFDHHFGFDQSKCHFWFWPKPIRAIRLLFQTLLTETYEETAVHTRVRTRILRSSVPAGSMPTQRDLSSYATPPRHARQVMRPGAEPGVGHNTAPSISYMPINYSCLLINPIAVINQSSHSTIGGE